MAGIFDMPGDDPLNYGLLQAGGALLTPTRQGGGLGPAVGAFGRTVSAERQNQIDAQLKKLLIESRRRDLKDPHSNLPSDVRSTNAYLAGSPEWKAAYELVTKQNKIFDVAGIKYTRNADGSVVQLTPTQEAALNAEILARAKSFGTESEKSRFDTKETVDSQNRPTYNTVEEILRAKGTLPTSPRLPNALSGPYNPAIAAAGPPAQRPPAAAPVDYPTIAALRASGAADAAVLDSQLAPRPPSAGAADRAKEAVIARGEGEAIVAANNLQNKLPEVDAVRNLGNTLKNHPGAKWAIGIGGIVPDALQVPNTSHADYMAFWEETMGKQFAQAFESLKGGGQITVIESTKAQQALSRLSNRKQTKASWDKAVDDFVEAYEAGMKKINARALGQQPKPITEKTSWDNDKERRYQEWKRSRGQ